MKIRINEDMSKSFLYDEERQLIESRKKNEQKNKILEHICKGEKDNKLLENLYTNLQERTEDLSQKIVHNEFGRTNILEIFDKGLIKLLERSMVETPKDLIIILYSDLSKLKKNPKTTLAQDNIKKILNSIP